MFGLGNPGLDYVRTRHNVGWWVLDELARQVGVDRSDGRHRGQVDYCRVADVPAALVKPTTFMNRSGQCVRPWLADYPDASWIVVVDDISMATGKLRLRRRGSSGGHRGLESVTDVLRTEEFMRLKVGVGEPPPGVDAAQWVLEPPTIAEEDVLAGATARAAGVIKLVAAREFEAAQQLTGKAN